MEEIMLYNEREKIKKESWDDFRNAKTPYGKASALLNVIMSHYWRQREAIESDKYKKKHLKMVVPKKYSPGYELDIDHYTLHWLHSMRHLVPKEVLQVLEDQWGYKPVKSEYLPDGCTIYQWGSNIQI